MHPWLRGSEIAWVWLWWSEELAEQAGSTGLSVILPVCTGTQRKCSKLCNWLLLKHQELYKRKPNQRAVLTVFQCFSRWMTPRAVLLNLLKDPFAKAAKLIPDFKHRRFWMRGPQMRLSPGDFCSGAHWTGYFLDVGICWHAGSNPQLPLIKSIITYCQPGLSLVCFRNNFRVSICLKGTAHVSVQLTCVWIWWVVASFLL